jgi:transposase
MTGPDALFSVGLPVKRIAPGCDAAPRVDVPRRDQVQFYFSDIDSLIPEDHPVRIVDAASRRMELTELYDAMRAREGVPGRPCIDPRLLLALWAYAILRCVGSARVLAELCENHLVYRWLCGGVSVNYHTLSDFRSNHAQLFDRLLIEQVARLRAAGLVTMDYVAHDGLRVRASAGSKSFRRKNRLEQFREEARAQVEALNGELHAHPAAAKSRTQIAQQRASRERLERVEEALHQYPDAHAKKKHDKDQTRVSTTDADARIMKMADGGFRPAYNVQLSADTGSQIVVSARVSTSGSDHALLTEAVEQIEKQAGCAPKNMLVDGGFNKPENIEAVSGKTTVYAPETELKDEKGKVLERKKPLPEAARECYERTKTEAGKAIYALRASTIECVNALARNRGLQRFAVRGRTKVFATVLLYALAHNLMREESLKREKLEQAGRKGNTS